MKDSGDIIDVPYASLDPRDGLVLNGHRALSYFQVLTEIPAMWIEAPIERGQLQYLSNRSVAHYRSEFEDHAEQGRRRHLVRTWRRANGSVAYDG